MPALFRIPYYGHFVFFRAEVDIVIAYVHTYAAMGALFLVDDGRHIFFLLQDFIFLHSVNSPSSLFLTKSILSMSGFAKG